MANGGYSLHLSSPPTSPLLHLWPCCCQVCPRLTLQVQRVNQASARREAPESCRARRNIGIMRLNLLIICGTAAAELESDADYKELKIKYLQTQLEILQLKLQKSEAERQQLTERHQASLLTEQETASLPDGRAGGGEQASSSASNPRTASRSLYSHIPLRNQFISRPAHSASRLPSSSNVAPVGGKPKCGGIFHLHLNKCGGTTIRNTFEQQARRTSDINRWQVMPSPLNLPREKSATCKAARILMVHWQSLLSGNEGRRLHNQLIRGMDETVRRDAALDGQAYQQYLRDPSLLSASALSRVDPLCLLKRPTPLERSRGALPVPATTDAVPKLNESRFYMEFRK